MEDNNLFRDLEAREQSRLPSYEWDVLRRTTIARDKKCIRCGEESNLEVDHVKPLCLGGENTIENLQLLCASCHKTKTRKDVKKLSRLRYVQKIEARERLITGEAGCHKKSDRGTRS